MKKMIFILIVLIAFYFNGFSQLFVTRTGFIGFYSKTSFEDIKAENNQVYAVVDAGKKNIAFSCLLKGFVFTKELMQEHFNENYVESDKYPKASFSGSYTGDVTAGKDGIYKVMVKGKLTLHNITRDIDVPATLELKGGNLSGNTEFTIKPEDYNIEIPSLVREKIEKQLMVKVKINSATAK